MKNKCERKETQTLNISLSINFRCSSDVGKTGDSGNQNLFLDQSCVNDMVGNDI